MNRLLITMLTLALMTGPALAQTSTTNGSMDNSNSGIYAGTNNTNTGKSTKNPLDSGAGNNTYKTTCYDAYGNRIQSQVARTDGSTYLQDCYDKNGKRIANPDQNNGTLNQSRTGKSGSISKPATGSGTGY